MKNHLQIKKIDIDGTFHGGGCGREYVFFPGIGLKMCAGTASGECNVRGNGRTMWGLAQAFMAALIRNLTGLGSPLAFPGSMCGALLAGLLYQYGKKLPFAYVGEVFGTGIIGGMLSYPIAYLIMGNKAAALFTFVVPFLISTCGGTIIAIIVTIPMKKAGILDGEIQRREKL